MTGWLFMLGLAALLFAGLWAFGGMRRRAFEFVAAALFFAFAGYQWQGRPGLAGAPAQQTEDREEVTASLIALRSDMDRNFTVAKRYIVPSDGYARRGDYQGAVQILRGGLKSDRGNADLWTAIGLQLMIASDGHLPPAAELAFDRARAIDPRHPGPVYFTGLAALREQNPEEALRLWSGLMTGDYRAGPWRDKVAVQTQALAEMLRAPAANARQRPAALGGPAAPR